MVALRSDGSCQVSPWALVCAFWGRRQRRVCVCSTPIVTTRPHLTTTRQTSSTPKPGRTWAGAAPCRCGRKKEGMRERGEGERDGKTWGVVGPVQPNGESVKWVPIQPNGERADSLLSWPTETPSRQQIVFVDTVLLAQEAFHDSFMKEVRAALVSACVSVCVGGGVCDTVVAPIQPPIHRAFRPPFKQTGPAILPGRLAGRNAHARAPPPRRLQMDQRDAGGLHFGLAHCRRALPRVLGRCVGTSLPLVGLGRGEDGGLLGCGVCASLLPSILSVGWCLIAIHAVWGVCASHPPIPVGWLVPWSGAGFTHAPPVLPGLKAGLEIQAHGD